MPLNEISILIVDDNPHFIQRMAKLFSEYSNKVHVHTAGNYDEALKQLDARKHDTILVDINLPGKNGIALMKKILERNCQCKVVVISNNASDYYRKQCEKLGAIHFLDKTTEFHLAPLYCNECCNDGPKVARTVLILTFHSRFKNELSLQSTAFGGGQSCGISLWQGLREKQLTEYSCKPIPIT